MKVMCVLKQPNIDVIADVNKEFAEAYIDGTKTKHATCDNVFICAWSGEYVKLIPFKAAKQLAIDIPFDNISMMFEVDEKLAKLHDKHISNYFKNESKFEFIDKEEYEESVKAKQNQVAEILGKDKK